MPIKTISPAEARKLVSAGASLVDVRSPDEHAREHIAGALNIPLERLSSQSTPDGVMIFHCRSGMRTSQAAPLLAEAGLGRECYILDGGISAWGNAGLPVEKIRGAPIEMQRQVMIAAGLLVLLGTSLSLIVSPSWIWLAIFVGAGLTVAGVTGFCGMARLLAVMPWNRPPARA